MDVKALICNLTLMLLMVSSQACTGGCLEGSQEYEQAKQLYEEAKQLPDDQERVVALEKSVATCPETLAYYTLGVAYLRLSDPKKALEALREALNRAADEPQIQASILGRRAEALLALRQVDAALAEAETARGLFAQAEVQAGGPSLKSYRPVTGPNWFLKVMQAIDTRPERQFMTAEAIGRYFESRKDLKAFDPKPVLDLYILFDSDQDQPNASGQRAIEELGKYLVATKGFPPQPPDTAGGDASANTFRLVGHTDKCADEAHNQDLSARRARHVAAVLERRFPALRGRVWNEGRGEREPRYATGDSRPDCDQALNRRVEIVMPW